MKKDEASKNVHVLIIVWYWTWEIKHGIWYLLSSLMSNCAAYMLLPYINNKQ